MSAITSKNATRLRGILIDTATPTDGQVLQYNAATNKYIPASPGLTAHNLVGDFHTASGLTIGHFLKATGATTFAFQAHGLTHTDVGAAATVHTHTAADVTSGIFGVVRGGTGLSTIASGKLLYTSAANTLAELSLGNTLSISAAVLNVVANTSVQKVTVRKNTGANIGSRQRLNFIEGSNVTLTIADDAAADEIDITITAAAGAAEHNLLSATHPDTVVASPVLGDILFANATPAWTKLAGNITTTKQFLTQTGTGTVSAAPVWGTITAGDLPIHTHTAGNITSGVFPIARGGTGADTAEGARANLGAAALGVNTDITALQGLNQQNAVQLLPYGTAAGQTGEIRFRELAANGVNYVGFKAPDNLAADNIYTLPTAFPTAAGQVLSSTTGGVLSWITPAAGITAGWELIGTGTFTTDFNITGLNGNADKLWNLIIQVRHTATFSVIMRFNSDIGSNYVNVGHWVEYVGGIGSHSTTLFATTGFRISTNAYYREYFINLFINPKTGTQRHYFGLSFGFTPDANTLGLNEILGQWINSTDNITTINIITGTITAGEYWLFKVKP